jgi:hypothetical protein
MSREENIVAAYVSGVSPSIIDDFAEGTGILGRSIAKRQSFCFSRDAVGKRAFRHLCCRGGFLDKQCSFLYLY